MPQVTSVFFGACQAGSRLESMDLDQLDWSCLAQDNTTFTMMKEAVSHVRYFTAHLSSSIPPSQRPGEEVYQTSDESSLRARPPSSRALHELLKCASGLADLEIIFNKSRVGVEPALGLDDIVGNTIWPELGRISLDTIYTR